jgi:hypothetical protein
MACDLEYDPASSPQYYRQDGWALPGVADQSPVIVEFPAQEFVLNGARKRMRSMQVKATIFPWRMHGRVVAYSYHLIPVWAHRVNGKWVMDAEAACTFTATFIDNKGDGVFRVLVPGDFTPELIPRWARPKKTA